MALDKSIIYGKDHRNPYTKSKAIDRSCRNHGACEYCRNNRSHKFRDKHPILDEELYLWRGGEEESH